MLACSVDFCIPEKKNHKEKPVSDVLASRNITRASLYRKNFEQYKQDNKE